MIIFLTLVHYTNPYHKSINNINWLCSLGPNFLIHLVEGILYYG
jgi:hypothetical protein